MGRCYFCLLLLYIQPRRDLCPGCSSFNSWLSDQVLPFRVWTVSTCLLDSYICRVNSAALKHMSSEKESGTVTEKRHQRIAGAETFSFPVAAVCTAWRLRTPGVKKNKDISPVYQINSEAGLRLREVLYIIEEF